MQHHRLDCMFTMVEHVHTTKRNYKGKLALAWDNVGQDSMAHYDTIIRDITLKAEPQGTSFRLIFGFDPHRPNFMLR